MSFNIIKQYLKNNNNFINIKLKRSEFDYLKKHKPSLYEYANKFYWTLSNYILAYRAISTNIISGEDKDKQKFLGKIMDKIISTFTSALSSIPVIGGVIEFIETTVVYLYKDFKDLKL